MVSSAIRSALERGLALLADSIESLLLFAGPLVLVFLILGRHQSMMVRIESFGSFLAQRGFGRGAHPTEVAAATRALLGVTFATRGCANFFFSDGFRSFEGLIFTVEVVAGLFLLVGLCTQWVIVFYLLVIIPVLIPASGWGSLENQVASMGLIAVFLLQGGRTWSADHLIEKQFRGPFFRKWFCYEWKISESGVALAKFSALFSYGTVSLYSFSMHLADSAWLDGSAGPLLVTNPFMSNFAAELATLMQEHPSVVLFFRIAMWIQLAWFVSLIWLPLVSNLGRLFTIGWGWIFFILSAAVLQLGFTATFEILLWFIIFGTFQTGSRPHDNPPIVVSLIFPWRSAIAKKNLISRVEATFLVTLTCFAAPLYLATIPIPFAPNGLLPFNSGSKTAALYGMAPINVFNEQDLRMRENVFVIRDKSTGSVLPVFQEDGSRGFVLASPRLYFGFAVPILRSEIDKTGCGIERNSEALGSLAAASYRANNLAYPGVVVVEHFKRPSPPTNLLLAGRYVEPPSHLICTSEVKI